ncbi:diphthamide biosynthesis protein 2 [Cyphellophora europaea CBS 101466]|uniref:2-(3-amino-3-carboxypropyl)histidine synthase subunit 2 n=1 Tax=Cyphellophora europaea (strain CBS 101466) TaxID=1220924 RepID=W2RRU3_CYPE1|nr:diphthamide biosynthesis protein 2 [Cyphellophora europaea CBS 101466]ETN38443.1 diphthamide biosynthesis protein 2 [Cyphellophora europaea CBS 101466]
MAEGLSAPPVLSTPDTHILNDASDAHLESEHLSDEQLETRYEIARTLKEIKQHRWQRLALQFPDDMLPHSTRVYRLLARGLDSKSHPPPASPEPVPEAEGSVNGDISKLALDEDVKLTILGDTSYGSCCVDEIAAEHVNADAVIHYGRSCLSPTARLPVVHVFTDRPIDRHRAIEAFKSAFPDPSSKVVVTADVPYASHVSALSQQLIDLGYTSVFPASILHDPSSAIPNRTVPPSVAEDPTSLSDWHMFHISEPPTSLLLTLTSSMASIKVFPTDNTTIQSVPTAVEKSTSVLLRRRYALVTSLSTVAVWGILINTLSVKNYLHIVDLVKKQISDAGKKSYLFVVGKINAAKVANFSEIGGWVVIGCWESSLIDSKDFYKPIITPFELQLALSPDSSRIWTGRWRSDFDTVLNATDAATTAADEGLTDEEGELFGSDDESEPPEFDLRTGRYITKTRPMGVSRKRQQAVTSNGPSSSTALAKRTGGDIVSVNGVASPAAEFLSQNRTWRGLEVRYDEDEDEDQGGLLEEGRTGVARGYTVGESGTT